MSPFRHGMAYADVLLPVAPFTETSGTFVMPTRWQPALRRKKLSACVPKRGPSTHA